MLWRLPVCCAPTGRLAGSVDKACRVVGVVVPFARVVEDVLADAIKAEFVSDDALVVTALPDGHLFRPMQGVDAFGSGGLVGADDCAERAFGDDEALRVGGR